MLWNDEALTKKFNSAIFPGLQGGPCLTDSQEGSLNHPR